jgi:general secretion pathway protein F
MTRFRYRAAQADGRVVSGVIAASGLAEVDALLLDRGLYPLTLDLAPQSSLLRSRASRQDLAIVFGSIAALVSAGVPLERAVTASAGFARHAGLRSALVDTCRLLTEGHRFSEALAQSEGRIPPVILGMVSAGERVSRLDAALDQAATQLEHEAELAGRVRQALTYPITLLIAGSASLVIIATVVVPRFAVILADLGQALPPATRALIASATFLRAYGFGLLLLLAGSIALLLAWVGTPEGRSTLHRYLLRLPVLGRMRHGFASARAARALGASLAAGVPILAALESAADAAGDAEVAARLSRAARRVTEGASLTSALDLEQTLTPTARQVLAVGDASGQLGPMALRAGDLAAAEAEGAMKVAVSLLEPALVVGFGGMVAFTAAALLQAVYSLRPG